MEFPDKILPARFIERPNRFLAVVDCAGERITAHLPNTGRLSEILVPGRPVYLAPACRRGRKTRFSLVLADLGNILVSLDSTAPNEVAAESISLMTRGPFAGYDTVRREVTLPGGRYDLLLTGDTVVDLVVEVKGVTLVRDGRALFPDAPTERGRRHIAGLMDARARGERAAILFLIMREDADAFSPNDNADPAFGRTLRQAHAAGVEVYAFSSRITKSGVWMDREVRIVW